MLRGASIFLSLVAIIFASTIFLLPASGEELQSNMSQTWPSRTPTSSSEPAKQPTPGNANPDTPEADQPAPGATSLPLSQQPTLDATAVPTTIVGNFTLVPTASPCGVPPTILALGPVSVRTGPALDYSVLGSLAFSDVRFIVGRADFSPWWLIQFDEHQQGWVSDLAVAVHGYIGDTSLATPISGIGDSFSQDDLWNPTPQPLCTPTGSNNRSQLAEFQTLVTAIPAAVNSGEPSPVAAATHGIIDANQSDGADKVATPFILTASDDFAEHSTGSLTWLPIAGFLMISVGAALLLLQSRRSKLVDD